MACPSACPSRGLKWLPETPIGMVWQAQQKCSGRGAWLLKVCARRFWIYSVRLIAKATEVRPIESHQGDRARCIDETMMVEDSRAGEGFEAGNWAGSRNDRIGETLRARMGRMTP